ncbi:MAG: radical SAM protein [archaeon]
MEKKLLLIDISCYEGEKAKRGINTFGTPLGLLSVATSLKKHINSLNIKIVDAGVDFVIEEEITKIIEDERPDFVGIRALSSNKKFLIHLTKVIKTLLANVFIIVGGPHVSTAASSEDNLEDLLADVIVLGEGEITSVELFNRLLKGEKYDDVKGIAFRKEGKFVFNERRELIRDLDSLPFIDYSLINLEKYSQTVNLGYTKNRFVCIESSRGCPYACIYCHNIFSKNVRLMSSERLFNEIKQLHKEYKITNFFFSDDIFNLNYNRAMDVFDKIINSGIKIRIHFTHGIRGDLVDKPFIDKMVEAGVMDVAFAVETPVPRLQKYINKNLNLNKLKENINYACEKGVIVRLFFMFGLPTETEEVEQTLEYMKQFKKCVLPFLFPAKYYKGTQMYSLAIQEGFSVDEMELAQEGLYSEIQFCKTPLLSREFMQKIHNKYMVEVLFNKERMRNAIDIQRKYFSDEEILLFYSSFFGREINSMNQILREN